ncbi:hypothetical protein BSKO_13803 [Bryopsis sp. KO-2023]|nr:hypothetical protein BSKO_13803 [Bryopsis sp. KO-2023]
MLGSGKVVYPVGVAAICRFSTLKRKPLPSIHETAKRKRCTVSENFLSGPLHAVASGTPVFQTEGKEKPEIVTSPYEGKTAIVVGAGPAGSVAGILLAKRGFNVKVIEKRSNPNKISVGEIHRSILLVINPEVTEYLLELGVDVATEPSDEGLTEFRKASRISETGEIMPGYSGAGKRQFLAERHAVAESILKTGFSKYLPNLKFIFDSKCEDVDVASRVVRFSNLDGKTSEFSYDLLIGADGINSRVREALQSAGHLKFSQRASKGRYVSIRNLPPPKEAPKELLDDIVVGNLVSGQLKQVWNGPKYVFLYQTKNGLVQGSLGGRKGCFEAIRGRELRWITKAAPDCFPKDYLEPFAGQLRKARPSPIGPVTYCSPYIGPNEALIGDACHSATPTLGIGANRAILDARDLDVALGNSQGNLTEALKNYDEECRPQVAAIQELEAVHPQAQLEGQHPLLKIFIPFYTAFHSIGNRLFPNLIPQSAFAQLFNSTAPPVEVMKSFKKSVALWGVVIGSFGALVASVLLTALLKLLA